MATTGDSRSTEGLRVGVMGAGAVGGFFGARLAATGVPVTLVARATHVDAMRTAGIVVDSPDGTFSPAVGADTDASALHDADVVLVAVKSTDTREAAERLAPVLRPDALVVSLQNGYDNAWTIAERLTNPVVPAAVYVSVEMAGPGRIRHNGGGSLVVGRPLNPGAGDAVPRFDRLLAAFARAGVPCRVSEDIRVDLWTKLTTNCAFNALSALTRLRYGALAADAGAREVMRLVVDESVELARLDGVPVDAEMLRTAVRRIAEVMPGALSSTAQDVLRGRRTEIGELNGYLVRRGQALGVPTPVNQTLCALVQLLEQAGASTA